MSAKSGKERQKERDALIAAYREGLGLVAIVLCGENGEVCIVTDQNIPEGAGEHWWCRNATEAGRVVSGARASLCRKSSSGREAILRAANRLNVDLHSDQDVTGEAVVVIDRQQGLVKITASNTTIPADAVIKAIEEEGYKVN